MGGGRTTAPAAFVSVLTAGRVHDRITALSSSGLVPPAGFEPATGRVETVCSDPPSYKGNPHKGGRNGGLDFTANAKDNGHSYKLPLGVPCARPLRPGR